MMVYVADTHALLWFLSKDKQLGLKAKEVFQLAERGETIIVIPVISLLEILYLCEKKGAAGKFKELLRMLQFSLNYIVFDLTLDISLRCADLPKVVEMHDRIITATAQLVHAKVITKDPVIRDSGYVEVVW